MNIYNVSVREDLDNIPEYTDIIYLTSASANSQNDLYHEIITKQRSFLVVAPIGECELLCNHRCTIEDNKLKYTVKYPYYIYYILRCGKEGGTKTRYESIIKEDFLENITPELLEEIKSLIRGIRAD